MGEPSASVVVTNHNYGRFLGECLESALTQTRPALEVIVIDDGSTDESSQVLGSFGGRIQVVRTENRGQAASLARGIDQSRGDVVCLLDADDVWYPEKVERVLEVMGRHPRVQWVRHALEVVDADRRPLGATLPAMARDALVPPRPQPILERTVTAATSGLSVRRDMARRGLPVSAPGAHPTRDASFSWDADAYLLARLTTLGAWGYSLAAVLGQYRRHGAQQFAGSDGLLRLIERQIAVGAALAELLDAPAGSAVAEHKHRLIAATLRGAPLLGGERMAHLGRGLGAALRAARIHPALGVRQLGALGLAFLAPDRWLRRLQARQGLGSP